MSQSIDNQIIKRVRATKSASVFSPGHFLDLGTRAAVDQALSRLTRAGKLRRISRGLYDLPRKHPLLGTLAPNPDAVAAALAGRRGARLRPSGAAAANLLGLSDQVPAQKTYLTDAALKKTRVGKLALQFQKAGLREMSLPGETSAMVVSALRSLGKGRITLERLTPLYESLPKKERKQLLAALPLAPIWMHPFLRYLATGKTEP